MSNRCQCKVSRKVESLGFYECVPLENGQHTMFELQRCTLCNGLTGFPDSNLTLALEHGTPETKKMLEAV